MAWQGNLRVAVPVGAVIMLASLGLIFPAPLVIPSVLAWWLHIDLAASDERRPGRLGIAALVVYAIAASAMVAFVVGFDSHFDCGGTLGGFGESSSARLDEACVSRRAWRPVVGGVTMVALTIAAGVRIRRSPGPADEHGIENAATSGTFRAVTTMAGLTVFMVALTAVLVLT